MKKTIIFFIIFILTLSYGLAEDNETDQFRLYINSTGELDLDLSINFTTRIYQLSYIDQTSYGSTYNNWDMYDDGADVFNKAAKGKVDNQYEYDFINSVYKFMMSIFNPRLIEIEADIEYLKEMHKDDQGRIFTLQKRVYDLETELQ